MRKVLVVPDVHGREFWNVVKDFDGEIVFLGDYHDPYNWEFSEHGKYKETYDGKETRYDIKGPGYKDKSVLNFINIINFAKENPKVTLLLGNHDDHYINGGNASRKDFENLGMLINLYKDNKDSFTYAKQIGNVLFTHAGVTVGWLTTVRRSWKKDVPRPENIVDLINKGEPWMRSMASGYRGGRDNYSGPLWHDYHENDEMLDVPQIFGHTQMSETGHIETKDKWACIDSRKVFEIDVDAENPIETLRIYAPEEKRETNVEETVHVND